MNDQCQPKITSVLIKNFRNFKDFKLKINPDIKTVCLIGIGDAGKTTILTAINWCLGLQYIQATDDDFHQKKYSEPIKITCTIKNLNTDMLRNLSECLVDNSGNEPDVNLDLMDCEVAIELTIDDSLKPELAVITPNSKRTISKSILKSLNVFMIDPTTTDNFKFNRRSNISKSLTNDDRDAIFNSTIKSLRNSQIDNIKLNSELGAGILNTITELSNVIETDFKQPTYTLPYSNLYSQFELSDEESLYRCKGLGSRRLLSFATALDPSSNNNIALIDEFEIGLEPHKARSLIRYINNNNKITQCFITTHSSHVISECDENGIYVFNKKTLGQVEAISIDNDNQKIFRKNTESLIAKRIIICEGRTEIGLIRAIDTVKDLKLSSYGIHILDGNGTNTPLAVRLLLENNYDFCVFVDSDRDDTLCKIDTQNKAGNKFAIFRWPDHKKIEDVIHDICKTCNVPKNIDASEEFFIEFINRYNKDYAESDFFKTLNDIIQWIQKGNAT